MKCVSNPHPRVRVAHDCSDASIGELPWELESRVDQASAKSSDINVIMATFGKQGITPADVPGRIGHFIDNTKIPSFLEAFDIVQEAKDLFLQLPHQVRSAMNNDPALMESFISDKKNHQFLYDYGVLEKKPVKDPDDVPLTTKSFKDVLEKTFKPKESAKKD